MLGGETSLPVASRNLFNFLLLSPGVIGVPISTFSTTQFTFGGTERAQWNLDGLDNTQHGSNRQIRLLIVTPEAVAQSQTLANGYSAEFGRAAGGQVNVLLRSGVVGTDQPMATSSFQQQRQPAPSLTPVCFYPNVSASPC